MQSFIQEVNTFANQTTVERINLNIANDTFAGNGTARSEVSPNFEEKCWPAEDGDSEARHRVCVTVLLPPLRIIVRRSANTRGSSSAARRDDRRLGEP